MAPVALNRAVQGTDPYLSSVPWASLPLRDQWLFLGSVSALVHKTQGFPSSVSHLYFHTALEADHRAQGRRLLVPGCLRRISVSLWSCPGPADTQKESMITPIFLKKTDLRSSCIFMAFTTKCKLFQSYFQCSIGWIYLHSSNYLHFPKLFFLRNKRGSNFRN